WAPVPQFMDVPGLIKDLQKVTDAARAGWFSAIMAGLAVLKSFKPFAAPPSLGLTDVLSTFDMATAMRGEKKHKELYGNTGPDRHSATTEDKACMPCILDHSDDEKVQDARQARD